jgi:hypothetical protein
MFSGIFKLQRRRPLLIRVDVEDLLELLEDGIQFPIPANLLDVIGIILKIVAQTQVTLRGDEPEPDLGAGQNTFSSQRDRSSVLPTFSSTEDGLSTSQIDDFNSLQTRISQGVVSGISGFPGDSLGDRTIPPAATPPGIGK